MKKQMVTIMILLGMVSILLSQNLLVNGDFSDGLDGWTHNPTMDGGVEGVIEVYEDELGPAAGNGPYLGMFCEGDTYFNQCIWQPVAVNVGDTLVADGAFKDMTAGGLTNYWCELYLGLSEPVENVDYTDHRWLAFNWWDGCANNIDGTFLEDACVRTDTSKTYWVVPDSLGSGEVTIYFMIKTGIWTDGSDGVLMYDVAIDSLTLTRKGSTTAVDDRIANPSHFVMHPVAPNPFNPSTTIRFDLAQPADIELAVFDVQGRRVQSLVQRSFAAGEHTVSWNGMDDQGQTMPSGVYFCRLQSEHYATTQRMLLIR